MNIEDIQSVEELVANLVEIVSCNGNVLINVGPTKEGTISPIFQERLTQMGQWLTVNGQAIYSTVPFVYQNDSLSTYPQVWYTLNPDYVYATALGWPKNDILTLGDVKLYQNISTGMLAFPHFIQTLVIIGKYYLQKSSKAFLQLNVAKYSRKI